MQKILIPTDFSPVSENALNYAIEIAAKFGSELILCHVYHIHKIDYNFDFPDDEQPYKKELERKMNLTKLKFRNKISQRGLSLQTIVKEDNIFSLFERKVAKHDIDLIVMGSKGASGLERIVFGSVAATALGMAKIPVLVVPPEYAFHSLERIILATDLNEISANVLSLIQRLASKFGAKVTVLYVNKDSNKDLHQQLEVSLKDVETTYREVPMSNSINESINQFIGNDQGDLLCMIRREKGFFERVFQRSITKSQVCRSEIPLLVLPEHYETS